MIKIRKPEIWDQQKLATGNYFVLTLHRPSNVDDLTKFSKLMESIDSCSGVPVIFPVHPRTRKNFSALAKLPVNIIPVDPLSYLEFIYLIKNAKAVITDSGGVQEETTVLGIPCVTLRNNKERPETVKIGTNEMIGENMDSLADAFKKVKAGSWKKGAIPELWDGRTSQRIVDVLLKLKL